MEGKTGIQSLRETLRSPGSWFLLSNAVLNAQTHPAIAFGYAAFFTTQRVASHYLGGAVHNPVANFLLGPQGPLFLNAVVTGAVGVATALYGSPLLAAACFSFGISNFVQSVVYGGLLRFPTSKKGNLARGFVLAGCEVGLLHGLSKVAQNAGFNPDVAMGIVAPGMTFALIRSFKPNWLPASFAYADMMAATLVISAEALITGNILNAVSRWITFAAFSRLAVARAQHDGKDTVFAVEKWIPGLYHKVRSRRTSSSPIAPTR